MWPISRFERFEQVVLQNFHDYGEKEWVTYGILIVDARQGEAKEYIINYLLKLPTPLRCAEP